MEAANIFFTLLYSVTMKTLLSGSSTQAALTFGLEFWNTLHKIKNSWLLIKEEKVSEDLECGLILIWQ